MIRRLFKFVGGVLVLLLALGLAAWGWATYQLSKDAPKTPRPTFSHFEMGAGAADGSKPPAKDGVSVDSAGRGWVLPPMPAEKPMDIHTAANNKNDLNIKTCFWPGPRARNGVYTNDGNSPAFENQLPDTATTYVPTAFKIPEGGKLIVKGQFPHMRHWNFNTYNDKGLPQDSLTDIDMVADAGSSNPFLPGVSRDTKERNFTFTILNGQPVSPRPNNTLYTNTAADKETYIWIRNYVPDHSANYTGGVQLPSVQLQLANGRILSEVETCEATRTPARGRQLANTVDPRAWVILTHLPWVDTANVGAVNAPAVPFKAFFNRQQVVADLFFPILSSGNPEAVGGWWSNKASRYGYVYTSRNFGKVYAMTGKLPNTPKTWARGNENIANFDMRYMSVCASGSPVAGLTTDCVYDEQLASTADSQQNFTVIVSRQEDRPSNATEKCGVVWLDMGNGDGMINGSTEYGALIVRHTTVNANFKHSWFGVPKPGMEKEAMGDYLPYLLNLKTKENFEALGCPVDKSKILAMRPQ